MALPMWQEIKEVSQTMSLILLMVQSRIHLKSKNLSQYQAKLENTSIHIQTMILNNLAFFTEKLWMKLRGSILLRILLEAWEIVEEM